MAIATATSPAESFERASSAAPSAGWIVSPAFDLLFFVNVAWLLAWLPGYSSGPGTTHLDYWQLFFITTPHRWITLALVAADPDRRVGRQRFFAFLAIALFAVVWGLWFSLGTFRCLVIADAVWNGWHFASQHSGIARIYGRKVGDARRWLDVYLLRAFVCVVLLRLLGWTTGWLETDVAGQQALLWFDRAWLGFGALIFLLEVSQRPFARFGKVLYVTSVLALYGSVLWGVSAGHTELVTRLAVAAALFHAVEYLAIVTSYAWRRRSQGSVGLFRQMANRWLLVLALYVTFLGVFASYAETSWRELWAGLNLWAAFLHYAYDGMIWKLRQPATAAALGATPGAGGA